MKLTLQRWGAIACLVSLAGFLVLDAVRIVRRHRVQERQVQADLRAQARRSAQDVESLLERHTRLLQGLARELEGGRLRPGDLPHRLEARLREGPVSAVRIRVTFPPGTFQPEALMVETLRRGTGFVHAQGRSGRTISELPDGQVTWDEPTRTDDQGHLVATCHLAFHARGPGRGVLDLDMALDGIQKEIQDLVPGVSGYGLLLSRQGVFLADPLQARVRESQTIQQVARASGDAGRLAIARAALAHEPGFAESSTGLTGLPSWIILEPVPSAQWSLGLVALKGELLLVPPGASAQRVRMILLAVGLAWCVLGCLLVGPGRAGGAVPERNLWGLVLGGSLATSAGMGLLWFFSFTYHPAPRNEERPILTRPALEAFKEDLGHLGADMASVPPRFLRTGVFISQLDPAGPNSLRVCGQVWGRFPRDLPPEDRGFLFPEAVSLDQGTPTVLDQSGEFLVLQPFKAVFPMQKDTVRTYPFDQSSVRLRLWPKRFHGNLVLQPDLASYTLMAPSSLPGVDAGLSLPGWVLRESRFSYLVHRYNTRFGVDAFIGHQESPELAYTLVLRRKFTNPFIATFLPILVVASLLFALLLTVTRMRDRASAIGYNVVNVLRSVISLFFPVVLAQINLRSQVVMEGLLYIEYYYFAVYLLILAVAADALAVAISGSPLLAWRDNLAARLLFWPILTGLFFGISVLYLA
jgi:hypothetical protein